MSVYDSDSEQRIPLELILLKNGYSEFVNPPPEFGALWGLPPGSLHGRPMDGLLETMYKPERLATLQTLSKCLLLPIGKWYEKIEGRCDIFGQLKYLKFAMEVQVHSAGIEMKGFVQDQTEGYLQTFSMNLTREHDLARSAFAPWRYLNAQSYAGTSFQIPSNGGRTCVQNDLQELIHVLQPHEADRRNSRVTLNNEFDEIACVVSFLGPDSNDSARMASGHDLDLTFPRNVFSQSENEVISQRSQGENVCEETEATTQRDTTKESETVIVSKKPRSSLKNEDEVVIQHNQDENEYKEKKPTTQHDTTKKLKAVVISRKPRPPSEGRTIVMKPHTEAEYIDFSLVSEYEIDRPNFHGHWISDILNSEDGNASSIPIVSFVQWKRSRSINTLPRMVYEILSHPQISDIISWQPHGRSFIIKKRSEFFNDILPRFAKKAGEKNFIRQLSFWCFVRVLAKGSLDYGSYYHPFFLRGKKFLISKMFCEKNKGINKPGPRNDEGSRSYPDFYALSLKRPLPSLPGKSNLLPDIIKAEDNLNIAS